jgi:hypothetical protein
VARWNGIFWAGIFRAAMRFGLVSGLLEILTLAAMLFT